MVLNRIKAIHAWKFKLPCKYRLTSENVLYCMYSSKVHKILLENICVPAYRLTNFTLKNTNIIPSKLHFACLFS